MDFAETAGQWANDVLVWVGFGTLVGLFAKAILPGRDPGGALATVLTGIAGSVIGCGTLMFVWNQKRVTPISVPGFVVAMGGALVLLGLYRVMAGRWFREGDGVSYRTRRGRGRVTVVRNDWAVSHAPLFSALLRQTKLAPPFSPVGEAL